MLAAAPPPEAVTDADRAAFASATGASESQMQALDAFRALLEVWSERFNLVGPSALADYWRRHALDSAQLAPLAPGATRWVDLGSGAGFPGVVLAIMLKSRPGARVELVESMAKRCRFLQQAVSDLDLPAVVHNGRAEALSLKANVVTARACAPLPRLLAFAAPHMAGGAVGLFLKGRDIESELTAARAHWRFDAELLPSLSDPSGRILKVTRLARA